MESTMVRLLLFACLALAAILLVESDLSATGYQAQMSTRVARDDNGNAQAPEPGAASDTGKDDSSNGAGQDRD
jgi:hypothetical protein